MRNCHNIDMTTVIALSTPITIIMFSTTSSYHNVLHKQVTNATYMFHPQILAVLRAHLSALVTSRVSLGQPSVTASRTVKTAQMNRTAWWAQ